MKSITTTVILAALLLGSSGFAQSYTPWGALSGSRGSPTVSFATNVVDADCGVTRPLTAGFNGSYLALGSLGWSNTSYVQTGQVLDLTLASPGGWAMLHAVIPPGAHSVVGDLTGPMGPAIVIGSAKVCAGWSFVSPTPPNQVSPTITVRAIVSGTLFVPSPTVNDCPAAQLNSCFQRFIRQ